MSTRAGARTRGPGGHAFEVTLRQLNAAINRALAAPELRERFAQLGLEPNGWALGGPVTWMERDCERCATVVKVASLRAD